MAKISQGDLIMVNVGDLISCPKCGKQSKIIWISKDRQTASIRCSFRHFFAPKQKIISAFAQKEVGRRARNIVFMVRL